MTEIFLGIGVIDSLSQVSYIPFVRRVGKKFANIISCGKKCNEKIKLG